jgi:hypothetical protein
MIDDFLLEMIFIAHKPKKTCRIEGLDPRGLAVVVPKLVQLEVGL